MNEYTLTEATTFGFGDALANLKLGERVARKGWNGQTLPREEWGENGMYLVLTPGSDFYPNREPWLSYFDKGHRIIHHPHIDMMTAQGYVVPWVASQTDLLAEDWVCV